MSKMSGKGFTLIELMVSISIVALLISILLPALTSARQAAQGVMCLSNLRQVGLAFPMYAQEQKGWLPVGVGFTAGVGNSPSPTWARVAAHTLNVRYIPEQTGFPGYNAPHDYWDKVRNNSIFQCPAENYGNFWQGKNATSYRHNSGHNGGTGGYGLGLSEHYSVTWPGSAYDKALGRVRDEEVVRPSNTLVVGEHMNITIKATAAEYDVRQFPYNDIHGVGTWHNGSGNFLWADGRATSMKPGEPTEAMFDRRK